MNYKERLANSHSGHVKLTEPLNFDARRDAHEKYVLGDESSLETWLAACEEELHVGVVSDWAVITDLPEIHDPPVRTWYSREAGFHISITEHNQWEVQQHTSVRSYFLAEVIPPMYEWILYPKPDPRTPSNTTTKAADQFFEKNKGKVLKVGQRVRDIFGDTGIVVKIDREYCDGEGTINVWQDARMDYGADNCEHYHYLNWRRSFVIIEDVE